METLDVLMKMISTSGLAVVLVICGVIAVYKAFPKLIAAYKEANNNLVNAIKELSVAFDKRLTALENKVDSVEDKVIAIETKIDNKED